MTGKLATITKTQMREFVNKQNLGDEAIGAMYGATRQAVKQLRDKMGIPARTAKNAARDKKIVRAYEFGGMAGTMIARKFGLSVSQTYRIINANKKKKKKKRRR